VTDSTPKTLHALLHTIVDYAGLFPPAGLAMDEAVRHYAACRRDAHAWMLGRFVAPAARLDELAAAMRVAAAAGPEHPWRVSALVGEDAAADFGRIALVTDIGWMRTAARLFAPLMRAEMHIFALDEIEDARSWIKR